jgi:hypothetical protein
MPKYYVIYREIAFIRDAKTSAKAASSVLRQKAVDLRRNTVVYVDERGHRTKSAALKYRVDHRDIEGQCLWVIAPKKSNG